VFLDSLKQGCSIALAVTDATIRSHEKKILLLRYIQAAIKEISTAAGPSGVVADMLKDAGELGEMWVTDVTRSVVTDGKIYRRIGVRARL